MLEFWASCHVPPSIPIDHSCQQAKSLMPEYVQYQVANTLDSCNYQPVCHTPNFASFFMREVTGSNPTFSIFTSFHQFCFIFVIIITILL
jgi:hypothetical protein